ncbi:MAG: dethiobiotin synthase, partial [Flavobacteriaceae bacterium]|nr:dethiobiotin synthase [Flavobacteriaceae bacterium]
VENKKTICHPNSFALETPMSPHAAAEIDGVEIFAENIDHPSTNNAHLVIEGAGGLLVPINNSETVADILLPSDKVVLVSRHYLGSINHSLLSLHYLQQKGLDVGVVFNGKTHPTTEKAIQDRFAYPVLGRLEEEPYISHHVVSEYASRLEENLRAWLRQTTS